MEIRKTVDGSDIILDVIGRLDTVTAPALEKEIGDLLVDSHNLNLNFAELEYVSSAGLRVLLMAQKAVSAGNGTLTIANVCEEVMEVLEITGFADILNIV